MRRSGIPRSEAGVTLIEVLVATTLLGLLLAGILFALRIGITAYAKTDAKLMENRRAAGAQRILESELSGLIPVVGQCGGAPGGQGSSFAFFQAQPNQMRMISEFSLQEGWRGLPQILEFSVIQGDSGVGVRLIVNEIPYTGALAASRLCMGMSGATQGSPALPQFGPVQASGKSFVLADKLAYCRFIYEWDLNTKDSPPKPPAWSATALTNAWPIAIRVEMAPVEPDPTILQPLSVTAPIRIHVLPDIGYIDGPINQ